MECNKEEALRAKGIAENKMQNEDFSGARKFALRAQQLYDNLENISQMLMVCDVHCAAEQKLVQSEMNWYGILNVEQIANEDTIKKQYRKFALHLHPDKNKFPGAEAAFKLVVEAQRVLLDQGKRSLYDMKLKASAFRPAVPFRGPKKTSWHSDIGVQSDFRNNFTGLNAQHQRPQPAQPGFSSTRPTFWTVCPYCAVKYQYYRDVINKSLRCHTCDKTFVAYEMPADVAQRTANFSQPVFPQQGVVPNQGAHKMGQEHKGNVSAEKAKKNISSKRGCTSEVGKERTNRRRRKQLVESSESCDSQSSSDSREDMEVDENGDMQAGNNSGYHNDKSVRRSGRHKRHVSYKENASDDDELATHMESEKGMDLSNGTVEKSRDALKRGAPKMSQQFGFSADVNVEQKEVKQEESACFREHMPSRSKVTGIANGRQTVEEDNCKRSSQVHDEDSTKNFDANADSVSDSKSGSLPDPEVFVYPDPEVFVYPDPDFNDFDNARKEECFAAGQVWATYDSLDGMPRFYALIKKVLSPGFKLRIMWLEPDPDDENEIEWVHEGLPTSCGKFNHGGSEDTDNRLMFSHLTFWLKSHRRGTYKIFPQKGETWALFKNWDMKWKSDVATNKKFEYEFVEILTEYVEDVGTQVAYLGKVKGFVSVFCQMAKEGRDSFQIPAAELFRFSHRIPSIKLTGNEREDVPKGSFELDPGSLPCCIEEISVSEDAKMAATSGHPSGLSSGLSSDNMKSVMGSAPIHQPEMKKNHKDGDSGNVGESCGPPPMSPAEAFEIPDSEFYNFDADKSIEKFKTGQIWSVYSDEDGLPKYYCQIKKIVHEPSFNLHVMWLLAGAHGNTMIRWHDKNMPITCGSFKLVKVKALSYNSTSHFSHQMRVETTGKNEYAIFPKIGEVWALYRNWTVDIKCSDLEKWEYDIIEVVEEDDYQIEVLVLKHVNGFNSVFKAQVKEKSFVKMEIPRVELLRFSHQIPAFRLTEERDGSLRDFWELDPAALPVHHLLR